MSKTITFKPGDACYNCGGPMPLVPLPSDDMRAAAARNTEPTPIPPRFDTRPKEQVEDDGRLFRCDRCDSKAIVKHADMPQGSGTGA